MQQTLPTSFETHLFHQGTLYQSYQTFGAHITEQDGEAGCRFTVWAPNAKSVSIVGSFNSWDTTANLLAKTEDGGIWSAFVPTANEGDLYKFAITTNEDNTILKADPFAFYSECRPKSASVVCDLSNYRWQDNEWMLDRKESSPYNKPMLIYEVHLGSWKQKEDGSFLTYRELALDLVAYVSEMGYTHIQLLPICEHPYDGSWGYQATGYYSVTSRYGTPHDFMYFVDCCHNKGIGVILDWVPAHFCKDGHGLYCFDGTPLYDDKEIAGWGTMKFDFGRPEVRSFLISNALFWLNVYHIDGLRVDAVASMLYLDYGKKHGEWTPNKYGGNGDLEAIAFIKQLNEAIFANHPQALMIAEESTEWPLVTRPTYDGGLGFNFKWNMGWMNDILRYMETDSLYRKWHHNLLTFSFLYAFSENFVLPLSHDEVVHGKRSLIEKMPGDYWQKFANLRTLLGYMIAHPGKKLLFMGSEIAQFIEWRYYESLEWELLQFPIHRMFQQYVRELNNFYLRERALWELEQSWDGFQWIDCDNCHQSIIVLLRKCKEPNKNLVIVCNFTPQYYDDFRIGITDLGKYQEIFNSDYAAYGGSGKQNEAAIQAEKVSMHNQPYSLNIKVPPLAFIVFKRISEC